MAIRILARNGDSNSYLIGDGDANQNPMLDASVVDLDLGVRYPPQPFQQHLKWGDWKLTKGTPRLLAACLACPLAKQEQGVP